MYLGYTPSHLYIRIPCTPVNKVMAPLVRRLAPDPGGPSPHDYSPPDRYKLAYSMPCANPYHHLPEETPRLHAPVHVPMHVVAERRVLTLLQICVSDDQDGRYDRWDERAEQSGDEFVPPHQVGGDYRADDIGGELGRMDLVVEDLLAEVHIRLSTFLSRFSVCGLLLALRVHDATAWSAWRTSENSPSETVWKFRMGPKSELRK